MDGAFIAIILDNQNISNTLKVMLEDAGFASKIYTTSSEALADFTNINPTLVVHCSGAAQSDGPEFAREMRRHHETPILFLSVDADAIKDTLSDDALPATYYLPMQDFSERTFIDQVSLGCD